MGIWSLDTGASALEVFLAVGWDIEPRADGSASAWSIASRCRIGVPAPPPGAGPLGLELELHPFVNERVPYQDVWVYSAGLFCAFERLAAPGVVQGSVPAAALSGSTLALDVVVPCATRPVDIGMSADMRLLGVGFRRLALSWA
jgi:hypothetical protein